MIPSVVKSSNARATVGRDTLNCLLRCASLGSRPDAPYFPAAISVSRCREISRCLCFCFSLILFVAADVSPLHLVLTLSRIGDTDSFQSGTNSFLKICLDSILL